MEEKTTGKMVNNTESGHILSFSCLSNAFKLKLKHSLIVLLIEMNTGTEKNIAKNAMKVDECILPGCVTISHSPPLISNVSYWTAQRCMNDWRRRILVGSKLDVVIM